MADYDLGTAHGRIVVDYKDNGTGKAQKDLDGLRAKAKQLLQQFQETTQKYTQGARKMASEGSSLLGRLSAAHRNLSSNTGQLIDDIDRLVSKFAALVGAMALVLPVLTRTSGGITQMRGGISILSQLRGALGRVPSGAEGFPSIVKRIMQVSAAIGLFASASGLLAGATARFRGVSAVTGLLARFGSTVNGLAKPLHAVAGIAGAVAFQILQFRFVKAVLKPLLAVAGAFGAIGAAGGAIHVIAGLASSIKDLTGVAGLLPAVLGVVVFGLGALKIATLGVADAFKAWNDPKKFAEALKKLHPEAAKTVLALKSLEGVFKDAQKRLQGRLFAGLDKEVSALGKIYIPILENSFGRIVDVVNDVAKSISEMLQESDRVGDIATIGTNIAKVWENLAGVFAPIAAALIDILVVSTDVLEELTGGAKGAARSWAAFIAEARKTGKLKQWILSGVQALKDLWGIIKNVGLALGGIWKGLNGGEAKSFLKTLNDLTAKFNEWIRSVEGQRVLGLLGTQFDNLKEKAGKLWDLFMTQILPVLEKWLPIAAGLSEAAVNGLTTAITILAPIFSFLADVITPLLPILKPILASMITMTVVLMGLGVAAKIVGGTLFILKSGLNTVKGAMAVAGFATRLLTGNLRSGELAALRFAGALSKNLVKGIYAYVRSSKLIKGAAVAAALGAVAYGMNRVNEEAKGAENLTGWDENLQDIVGAGEQIANFDFGAIFADIRGELGQLNNTWSQGEAPIQKWFERVKSSFMTDFVGFFQGLPGKVAGWLSGVGQSFMTNLGTPVADIARRIKDSFMTDFVGFFTTTLPTSITTGLTTLRTTIQTKWNELAGDAQGLPERIMHALGSLTGMFLNWVATNWTTLRTTVQTKWNEIVTDAQALPGRIGTALVTLGQVLWQKAQEAWQQFKDSFTQKTTEVENDTRQIPTRISNALSALASTLAARAREAWDNFKREAQARIQTAIADAQALPGRVAAAISGLASQLMARAREAWNSFKASALATMNGAIADARALPGRIVAAIGNLGSTLYQSGVNLIDGFKRGIDAAKARVLASIQSFMAGVRSYFPFSPAKRGPFAGSGYTTHSGRALVADFAKGMNANRNLIQSAALSAMRAANLTGAVNFGGTPGTFATGSAVMPAWTGPVAGGDGSAAGPVSNTFNVTLDAKSVAEMRDVSEFFDKVQQKARAGRAGR